jgi:hypothetical protein
MTSGRWRRVFLCVSVIVAIGVSPAAAQFTSAKTDARHILEGRWQSCLEEDGAFSERVYDHRENGVDRFELHLGPGREFALFEGVNDEHRTHDSAANLLQPHTVLPSGNRASYRWQAPSLGVILSVFMAGEPRPGCESWFVVLSRVDKTSQ